MAFTQIDSMKKHSHELDNIVLRHLWVFQTGCLYINGLKFLENQVLKKDNVLEQWFLLNWDMLQTQINSKGRKNKKLIWTETLKP